MWKLLFTFLLLMFLCFLSLSTGSYRIGYMQLLDVLFSGTADEAFETVVFNIRLPRLMAAVAAGTALSVSGVIMQSIFKNLLVSPDLLGVSSGASLGTALAVVLGFSSLFVSVAAFVCGIAAVGITWLIAGFVPSAGQKTLLLVLAGIVVSAFLSGFVELICVVFAGADGLPSIFAFLFGNLERASMNELYGLFIVNLIGILILWRLHFSFDVLSLGENDAAGLGLSVNVIRNIGIVIATVLCSTVVAKFGLIGWVGLVVPHMARLWFGSYRHKVLIPASLLLGACFMVGADLIARNACSFQIPVGIVTSIVGAPFFVYILYHTSKEQRNFA